MNVFLKGSKSTKKKLQNFPLQRRQTTGHVGFFFKMTKTKFKRECFKPKLTEDHKTQRVSWCERMIENLGLGSFFTCFLDEKWFYPTSRRNVEKHVPAQDFEDEEDVYIPAATTRSRRFVAKVMYLGVIARPVKGLLVWLGKLRKGEKKRDGTYLDWANGKICLRRVSKMKKAKKTSYSKKFHTLGQIKDLLKEEGDWQEHYVERMTVGELFDVICKFYDINYLCFRYESVVRTKKRTYDLSYEEEDVKLEDLDMKEMIGAQRTTRELTIQDLDLFVRIKRGDEVEVDCSCDSSFMLSVMKDVGESVCNYFFWIPRKNGRLLLTVYLVIDNAGGHGTNKAIQE